MIDRQFELDLLRQHIARVTETGTGHAVLGRGAEPLLPLKEALAAYLGRTPDQIRRTLAHAAPHLLDAVPFIGPFLASIGEKLAEGSFRSGRTSANTFA